MAPADPGPGARERLDHLARRLRRPAAGRGRGDHAPARRVAQRQHDDVAVARGVVLRQRRDQADGQARRRRSRGWRAGRRSRTRSAARSPPRGRARGSARARSRTGPGSRRRRAAPASSISAAPASGWARGTTAYIGSSSSVRSSTSAGASAPSRRNVDREVDVAAAQLGERLRRPASRIVTSASGSRRRRSATASGTSRVSDDEWRGEPDAPLLAARRGRATWSSASASRSSAARACSTSSAPGVGQLRPAARAGDERGADLGLERGQVLRDGGLGEIERGGRAGQRAVVGDRAQRAQAPEVVHKWSLSSCANPACTYGCATPRCAHAHSTSHRSDTTRRLVEEGGPKPRFVRGPRTRQAQGLPSRERRATSAMPDQDEPGHRGGTERQRHEGHADPVRACRRRPAGR